MIAMPDGWDPGEVDRFIGYHGEITKAMTSERTSLESRLVPISAYVLISAVECYRRHPEVVAEIAGAASPEEVGAAGRRPGNQVDAVHLWSLANIYLHGRQILILLGRIAPDDAPERTAVVGDFWRRAARAYRGDGHDQAWDAGLTLRPYADDVVEALVDGTSAVDDDRWPAMKKLNATLTTYLFLLYFDTRAGIGDTGPYPLPDDRVLLVRDFSKLGASDFPWSAPVASEVPYRNLTAAYVLEDVGLRVNDWGTSVTDPEDYLGRVVRFGLFTTDGGGLDPVPPDELEAIRTAVRTAQTEHYRLVAKMERDERIDAGAYVYFTFARPFAEVAGVAEDIDWTVPRDSGDVYEMLAGFEGTNTPPDPDLPYYTPLTSST